MLLFIFWDGVEVSAERVYDMDVNRVESITILKDASATAYTVLALPMELL